jgi:hypothetical protein
MIFTFFTSLEVKADYIPENELFSERHLRQLSEDQLYEFIVAISKDMNNYENAFGEEIKKTSFNWSKYLELITQAHAEKGKVCIHNATFQFTYSGCDQTNNYSFDTEKSPSITLLKNKGLDASCPPGKGTPCGIMAGITSTPGLLCSKKGTNYCLKRGQKVKSQRRLAKSLALCFADNNQNAKINLPMSTSSTTLECAPLIHSFITQYHQLKMFCETKEKAQGHRALARVCNNTFLAAEKIWNEVQELNKDRPTINDFICNMKSIKERSDINSDCKKLNDNNMKAINYLVQANHDVLNSLYDCEESVISDQQTPRIPNDPVTPTLDLQSPVKEVNTDNGITLSKIDDPIIDDVSLPVDQFSPNIPRPRDNEVFKQEISPDSIITEGTICTGSSPLNMRDNKSTDGNIMTKVPKDAEVKIIDFEAFQDWVKIQWNGQIGYAYASYVCEANNTPTPRKRLSIFTSIQPSDYDYVEDSKCDHRDYAGEFDAGILGDRRAFLEQCFKAKGTSKRLCMDMTCPNTNPGNQVKFRETYGNDLPYQMVPSPSEYKYGITLAKIVRKLENKGICVKQITNWFRPSPYNYKVGGANSSYHMVKGGGKAVDILLCSRADQRRAAKLVNTFGKNGVWQGGMGIYDKSYTLHIDLRGYAARW